MSEDTKFLEEEYKYNFKTDAKEIFSTGVGLNEQVVREISKIKGEPEWMLEYRLKSLKTFEKFPLPNYGPDLSYDLFVKTNAGRKDFLRIGFEIVFVFFVEELSIF
jgi:hypothetical protein